MNVFKILPKCTICYIYYVASWFGEHITLFLLSSSNPHFLQSYNGFGVFPNISLTYYSICLFQFLYILTPSKFYYIYSMLVHPNAFEQTSLFAKTHPIDSAGIVHPILLHRLLNLPNAPTVFSLTPSFSDFINLFHKTVGLYFVLNLLHSGKTA